MLQLKADDGTPLADPERVLRSSHQRVARVSVLDDLFNPLPGLVFTGADGYAVDGSVSQDASRAIRRTVTLTISNPDGVWTPRGEGSAFYWDRQIKVERGVVVGGVAYYAPLGVFLIDAPEVDARAGLLTLSGADRMDRATRSEFTAPTSYALGAGVGAAVRDILEDAGVGITQWSVDDGGATLGAARHYEVGEERLQAAITLANDFALEVLADANGFMVVRPKRDPQDLPSSWTFKAGVDATHLGLAKRWSRDRFYNHILVTGESADQEPLRAEASVTDPSNPLRVTGPMGDRLFKYTSAMITTVQQAQDVADAMLWERALIEEELSIEHVVNPMLEAGDAIRVEDNSSATDDKYAIASLDLPIAAGPASLNVKKVRTL